MPKKRPSSKPSKKASARAEAPTEADVPDDIFALGGDDGAPAEDLAEAPAEAPAEEPMEAPAEDPAEAPVEAEVADMDTMELGGEAPVAGTPSQKASRGQPFGGAPSRGAHSTTLTKQGTTNSGEHVVNVDGEHEEPPIPPELQQNDFGTLKLGDDGGMTLEAYDGPVDGAPPPPGAMGAGPEDDLSGMTTDDEMSAPTDQSGLSPDAGLQRPRGMSIERSPDVDSNVQHHLPPGPTISPDQQKLLEEMGLGAGPLGFAKAKQVQMMPSDIMMQKMEQQLGISWRRDRDREIAIDQARMAMYEHYKGNAIFKDVPPNEPAYDPEDYQNIMSACNEEMFAMFKFITSYNPQHTDPDHRLKAFIPDYLPAIGDIDAFIKVDRPDGDTDTIGLSVLDEPRAQQSDQTVLDMQLRAVSKKKGAPGKQSTVTKIEYADRNPKAVAKWVKDMGDLHKSKAAPSVHYSKPMPDIDLLMQEWPTEFEEMLQAIQLPSADLDCKIATYVDIVCALLDVPVYKSRVQSLHVLFTLYSAFKSSGHFGQK